MKSGYWGGGEEGGEEGAARELEIAKYRRFFSENTVLP